MVWTSSRQTISGPGLNNALRKKTASLLRVAAFSFFSSPLSLVSKNPLHELAYRSELQHNIPPSSYHSLIILLLDWNSVQEKKRKAGTFGPIHFSNSCSQFASVFTGAMSIALLTILLLEDVTPFALAPLVRPTPLRDGRTNDGWVMSVWRRQTAWKLLPSPMLWAKIAPRTPPYNSSFGFKMSWQTFLQQNCNPSFWWSFNMDARERHTETCWLSHPATSRITSEFSNFANSDPINTPLIAGELRPDRVPDEDTGSSWARFFALVGPSCCGRGWGGARGWYSFTSPDNLPRRFDLAACFFLTYNDVLRFTTLDPVFPPFLLRMIISTLWSSTMSSSSRIKFFSSFSRSINPPKSRSSYLTDFFCNISISSDVVPVLLLHEVNSCLELDAICDTAPCRVLISSISLRLELSRSSGSSL